MTYSGEKTSFLYGGVANALVQTTIPFPGATIYVPPGALQLNYRAYIDQKNKDAAIFISLYIILCFITYFPLPYHSL